mmetsp:Transcript_49447/g.91223  ORF Transcript_49447/g.91223 Transcript_49447/m.91223 type:complete len:228 (-) Transcript_49447:128-811(-)
MFQSALTNCFSGQRLVAAAAATCKPMTLADVVCLHRATLLHLQRVTSSSNKVASLLGCQGAREPVQALVEPIAGCGAGRLDEPLTVAKVVQSELLGDLRCRHSVRQILLVGEDKHNCIAHLILIQHLGELLTSILNSVAVIAVDDEDEAIGACVVVPPEWSDLVLATHIPDGEGDVLVLNGLNIESNCWDRCDNLTKLQFVEDGGLPRCIQTHHQDTHLLFPNHALP